MGIPWDPNRPAGNSAGGSRYDPVSAPITLEEIAGSRILQSLGVAPEEEHTSAGPWMEWLGDKINPYSEEEGWQFFDTGILDALRAYPPGPPQPTPQGVATGPRELGLASSPNLPTTRVLEPVYPEEHRIEDYQGYGPPRGTGGQGSTKERSGYGANPSEVEQAEDISKFDQQIQSFRDRLTDQADTDIAAIKEYRETGLQKLSKSQRTLRDSFSRQDKLWADLTKINAENRLKDFDTVKGGYETEVDETKAYLVEMGIKNPSVYTDKPKNMAESLMQASFTAGADTVREIDLTRQFVRDELKNMNMTGFATAQAELLTNVTQELSDVGEWLREGMATIDDAVLNKEIAEEQAAQDGMQLYMYAAKVAKDLGVSVDSILAHHKMGTLGKLTDEIWEPDERLVTWQGEDDWTLDDIHTTEKIAGQRLRNNQTAREIAEQFGDG